jgi:D-tagatose-1,6-bisphosphate aldolase subunit GatZ/KbaZ
MKINDLIKDKSLPSFCTANFDVIESIFYYCLINKFPCLIECTSNQVNQDGGYTSTTPKLFVKKINKLRKKIKLNQSQLFLGGDHLGPLPWKNNTNKIALKKSIKLINNFLNEKFDKIHIDTSIKCKNDHLINNEIIFDRTCKILNSPIIKKKIDNKFLVIGTEVPLSGSDDDKKVIITSIKKIKIEALKFQNLLINLKLKKKFFGLVIEPGMKYMNSSIKKPIFTKFLNKKKFSKANDFVFEAHSTDYQPKKILLNLVDNNFKFLKVGPELTYNYSRSLFFMNKIENKFFKNPTSDIKKNILLSMKEKNKYWKEYYDKNNDLLLLNSKLDRSRYYLNTKNVENSIRILKNNINILDKKNIISFIGNNFKKDFLFYNKKRLSNFDNIKLIFISKTLKRYFSACGFKNT